MTVVSERETEAELPERWSAKAKTDVVLRLLRGESVDAAGDHSLECSWGSWGKLKNGLLAPMSEAALTTGPHTAPLWSFHPPWVRKRG